MPLLELSDVTVAFGGVHAVDHVSIHVEPATVTGLIGPNGAGKTTLIDAMTGFVPLAGGRIDFRGKRIDKLPAHRRTWLGMARTFQSLELLEDLTVRENLMVVAEQVRWWSALAAVVRPGAGRSTGSVDAVLDSLDLTGVADVVVTRLSHGQRKLVSVGRALAAQPDLVVLDEPAAGLDPPERDLLRGLLQDLTGRGTTVLLVDHDMGLVLDVCDLIWVVDFGNIISSGPPEQVRDDPLVIDAYLGVGPDDEAGVGSGRG